MSLIGREEELRRLGGLLEGVGIGGGAVLLRGEAGIGKSALLAELAERASDMGLRVLTTVGIESEAHLHFAGLHQLLRPVRRDIDLLPPRQRDALRAALGLDEGTVVDVFLVALAALDLLSEIATRKPVLVIAEDAHWLDSCSADVIAFLGRRLASEPIVLAAAVREDVPSRFDDAGLPELVVPPLSREHAETLLDARAAGLSESLRRRVLGDAAGNPLALIELPVAAQGTDRNAALTEHWLPLTERLERAFTARVASLPELTATALLVAALDDGGSVAETARAAQVLTGRKTGRADLAPAVVARLIEIDGDSLRFRHPLMRSAIHQLATAERRQAAHAALAEVLADAPERSVWHRAAATDPPDEEVATELETVAQESLRRGAVTGAVTALEHAARLSAVPDLRADRLLRAADLAVELGSQNLVDRLLGAASRLDLSPQQRARLAWTRASLEDGLRDGTTDALALVRLAESMVTDGHVDTAIRILWSAALRCFWTEPDSEARDRIVAVAERLPIDELDPRILAILAYAAPIERGTVVIDRSRRLAAGSMLDAQAERLLGSAAVLVGAFDFAQGRSAASVAGLRAEGRLQLLARALAAQAWSAAHLVDLNTAIPAAEEAGELARETGQPYLHALVQATQAKIAALRGDGDSAEELAAAAVRTGISVGARPVLATAQNARALAALAAGEFSEAFARFSRLYDVADPSFQLALRCCTVVELADAAVRSGEQDAAAGIVAGLEHAATVTTAPSLHAGLRLARALLADGEQAESRFAQALQAVHAQPFLRAYTELTFGEWLRRRRRVAESRPPLRSARDAFDALGAVPWGERARRELRAAGEQSGTRRSSAVDRLTPQELQIAQLAATGLTNREIGQRLYVSHRTVGAHLSQVFPKLQITSRAQLRGIPGLVV
ncbi:AAA family ATPase [Pseudonocardia xinjiangensis]|uniref:Helix-turn-helix domain-containing protein n=1 Tax=Pseudonocardia xinjiangensis TaxID=75289 RepID=A0ABX1RE07_9PSEU|nr:helix-turn-helix domain-containing protein [Pseudonocardia xinjiangensis]